MIRPMTLDDIAEVSEIEQAIFSSPWKMEDFASELTQNPFGRYFVFEDENQIAGYIGIWILFEQAQITTLGVAVPFRRKGIARLLLDYAVLLVIDKGVTAISLEVRVGNTAAIALYESAGFIRAGIRKDYYQDNHEDAYLMVLERN
jgi:ribosomal-protein-alanine N-acetyltransferase